MPEYVNNNAVNSILRIKSDEYDSGKVKTFSALEHFESKKWIGDNTLLTGITGYKAWSEQLWKLTALPQMMAKFRNDEPSLLVNYYFDGKKIYFAEKIESNYSKIEDIRNITVLNDDNYHYWLDLDYNQLLQKYSNLFELSEEEISIRFGELCYPKRGIKWGYSTQFGLYEEEKENG